MNKNQFTISKLTSLKESLESINKNLNSLIETHNNFSKYYQSKIITHIIDQKELFEKTLINIKAIINTLSENFNGENYFSNHLALTAFNIFEQFGSSQDLHDFCCFGEFIEKEE